MPPKRSRFAIYLIAVAVLVVILAISIVVGRSLSTPCSGDLPAWVQAVGAIAAIVAGFAVAADQQRSQQVAAIEEKNEFTRAAHMLAHAALQTVSERLDTALTPKHTRKGYALQGDRTTEMVTAVSQLDTARIPSEILPYFIRLRSHVFAINSRISEIYDSESRLSGTEYDKKRSLRHERLESSVKVFDAALVLFHQMQDEIANRFPVKRLEITVGPSLQAFDRTRSLQS
ncbi:hypothetical protein [Rhizobium indigoferae]|uniref:LemA family protein n=1 Tax=Rhizobium indigoferae TaxID=158891 RepID=A0ABZ0ZDK6_9HYPH|nr:hypothetical protein [Rhizobium indigoferae]NNU56164.1 hypothetical protein [Rhizobium indigoferae]WQN37717.1 hypothetical protein U5G49_002853 [Rhizobium indigoferae]GLR59307.1 hypothetical protein GCM10007919_40340 [Rhizobium indigoferae]